MRADEILQAALDALKQRAAIRDQNSERSMELAVNIYNSTTRKQLTESEGWRFMCCLKLARSLQGGFSADDYIDLAGYAALLGECEANENESL